MSSGGIDSRRPRNKHGGIMKRAITTVLVALIATVALTAGPATARVGEMTTEQAGTAYLSAICKGNDARNEFSRRIWRDRERIGLAEVRVRLPQLKRLAGAYGRALNKSARMLYNPDAGTWPPSVNADVMKMAKSTANESYWRGRQSNASNANQWLRFNGRANNAADTGATSARIRAVLDLPPPGEGC